MAVGFGGEAIAAEAKNGVDLIACSKKPLCLPGGLEAPHDFLSSACRSMTAFDPVVEPLVGPVIGA